jgi:hypothetical protein
MSVCTAKSVFLDKTNGSVVNLQVVLAELLFSLGLGHTDRANSRVTSKKHFNIS